MGTATSVACPHCGATNTDGAAFCQSCGKALPNATATGPRVLTGDALPTSAAGQAMVSDELTKQTKKAANALLAVGILQATLGAVVVWLLSSTSRGGDINVPFLMVLQFAVAGVFIGLYLWARKAPLPASIVGLVIYATLVVLNVVSAMSDLSQGGPRRGIGGLGIGWLDIVIMVILTQGIQAGLKHKKLREGGL